MFLVSSGSENIDNNLLHLLPLLALCKFYGQIIRIIFILIADSKILNINRCFVINNPTQMSKRCSLLTNAMTWHCQLVLFTQKSMSNNIDENLFNYPIVQTETLTLTYFSSKLEPWKENLVQDSELLHRSDTAHNGLLHSNQYKMLSSISIYSALWKAVATFPVNGVFMWILVEWLDVDHRWNLQWCEQVNSWIILMFSGVMFSI